MYRNLTSILALAFVALLASSPAAAADSPRFRGPGGDGVFAESGLLASWPEDGPKLLWTAEGLGESYATVSIAGGRIFTTGMTDERGSAYALDLDGKALWTREYGGESDGRGYPGTRTTPSVHDGKLYLLSSLGAAIALDAQSGEVAWTVDLFERFGGKNTYFGVAESPLVVDGKVIFTAGGKDASVVALDPASGDTVWKSQGLSDAAAYCTPRLFDNGTVRQLITLVSGQMVGLDPETGKVLWGEPMKVEYDIHAVSPEFVGNGIYVSHGYDQGGMLFALAADGSSVSQTWKEPKLDVHHGGAVVVDGHIYGAASNGTWHALDAESGKIVASIERLGKGSIAYADGKLFGYTEEGKVVLVDPDPGNFREISSFEITRGSGNHWSHPVISDGVLYIRHGDVLMAYAIGDEKAETAAASR